MGGLVAIFFFLSLLISWFSLVCSEIENSQTYIVRVRNDMKPSAFLDVEQWYKASLQSLPQDSLLHVYKTVFHGFSAKLTKQQATQLSNQPGVIAVLPDRLLQLHTTRSPYFLGLSSSNHNPNGGLLSEADSGSNVIIGILDSGIWPERHSFHDEGLGPIPSNWKGECVEGENFTLAHCNNKIIGARFFVDGYEAETGKIDPHEEFRSARDSMGHGTHTASTAAGRAVENASLFGYANGTAVGVAPKARIAVYKVCWKNGCMDSDILSAFDKAVEDGVDIISISAGESYIVPFNLDPIAIGAFGAMERGVLVSASAGNAGPTEMTVSNAAPWMTTVGASTIDRGFPADLVLEDGRVINGVSLYSVGQPLANDMTNIYLPLIYGETCMDGSLDENLVRGKIVVCDRGGNIAPTAKGDAVRRAGGAAVVVEDVGSIANSHVIPGLTITESAGSITRDYINSIPNPRATMVFHGTQVGITPAPVVASFSSRGPNPVSPYLLIKPDLIAPGVNILAAWPDGVAPTRLSSDPRSTKFNVLSGTSMSCPHVSGVAALLKGAHPDWSPAMIRSAMMTTAYTQDNKGKPILDEKDYTESTLWAMGAGHVNPEKAVDPGLVYDITPNDYLKFLCATHSSFEEISQITKSTSFMSCEELGLSNWWDFNYPAISAVDFAPSLTTSEDPLLYVVKRTVTHVSESPAIYNVTVMINPKWVNVTVNPVKMEFNGKGEKQSYSVRITFQPRTVALGDAVMEMGKIVWSDGLREVVSPLVVRWEQDF